MCLFSRYGSAALASTLQGRLVSSYCWKTKLADEPGARPPSLWPLVDGLRVHVGGGITRWRRRRRRTVRPVAYRLKNGSYLLRASSPPTVTGWGCDTTLFLSSVDWLLWTDGSEVRVRSRGRRVHACPPPPCPSLGLGCGPHESGLLSGPRALFKSCSVGPQAFHGFNLATHGNRCT